MGVSLIAKAVAILAAGIFSGAAIYINAVEHPARMSCGTDVAIRQWAPSYHRATTMQAPLAILSLVASIIVWYRSGDLVFLTAGSLIGPVVPFTLLVILPTNRQLLRAGTETNPQQTKALLDRWNKLHFGRTILSGCAFILMLTRALSLL